MAVILEFGNLAAAIGEIGKVVVSPLIDLLGGIRVDFGPEAAHGIIMPFGVVGRRIEEVGHTTCCIIDILCDAACGIGGTGEPAHGVMFEQGALEEFVNIPNLYAAAGFAWKTAFPDGFDEGTVGMVFALEAVQVIIIIGGEVT